MSTVSLVARYQSRSYSAAMPAKPLTTEQKADAARLKAAFDVFQAAQRAAGKPYSQLQIAADMPFNQSAMSQYLTGKIPLNRDALVAFCERIGARPEVISPTIFREEQQALGRLAATKSGIVIGEKAPSFGVEVAHAMRLEAITVPSVISWESLAKMRISEIPAQFQAVMPDDALTGHIEKGTPLIFERDIVPTAGRTVLVEDADGIRYIRRYAQIRGGHWQAQATTNLFVTLDSDRDKLTVLATMTWRAG